MATMMAKKLTINIFIFIRSSHYHNPCYDDGDNYDDDHDVDDDKDDDGENDDKEDDDDED